MRCRQGVIAPRVMKKLRWGNLQPPPSWTRTALVGGYTNAIAAMCQYRQGKSRHWGTRRRARLGTYAPNQDRMTSLPIHGNVYLDPPPIVPGRRVLLSLLRSTPVRWRCCAASLAGLLKSIREDFNRTVANLGWGGGKEWNMVSSYFWKCSLSLEAYPRIWHGMIEGVRSNSLHVQACIDYMSDVRDGDEGYDDTQERNLRA